MLQIKKYNIMIKELRKKICLIKKKPKNVLRQVRIKSPGWP